MPENVRGTVVCDPDLLPKGKIHSEMYVRVGGVLLSCCLFFCSVALSLHVT